MSVCVNSPSQIKCWLVSTVWICRIIWGVVGFVGFVSGALLRVFLPVRCIIYRLPSLRKENELTEEPNQLRREKSRARLVLPTPFPIVLPGALLIVITNVLPLSQIERPPKHVITNIIIDQTVLPRRVSRTPGQSMDFFQHLRMR
jgi:hypothetical protein